MKNLKFTILLSYNLKITIILHFIEKIMKLPKLGDSISDATIVKMNKSKYSNKQTKKFNKIIIYFYFLNFF